ncbi:hypothetical protein TNCT6_77980 [Streptomyces sp. 6-11-2]|nr:hypothetical protein TNCT6_77980 [Streptomyces sp. 6-11-2]
MLGRSLNNIAGSAAQLAGLTLGGAAVAVLGARQALMLAAGLHLVAAAIVRLGLPRLPAPPADGTVVRASLTGNLRLLLAQWLPSSFMGGAEGLIVAYAGQRHVPAGAYALLMAALPVGMLAGDLVVGRLLAPRTRERLVVPLNYGAPRAAAELADQARHAAGTRPTAAATLAAAVYAHALNHQPKQARAALAAADALMNRLPEDERSDTWLTYGEQKHHVHLSHAFTTLGDTRRARESQQRALELSAPTSTMTRTLPNIDAAACAHHDGDLLLSSPRERR